jgi:hypothetical protein
MRPVLSLAGVRLGHAPTAWGLPCCVRSPCADMPSPVPRWDHRRDRVAPRKPVTAAFPVSVPGRLPHQVFRGLLGVHSRYGLPARGAAHSGPFHQRLRQFCYLHAALIATGWSDRCRVGLAPTEVRTPLHGAHRHRLYAVARKKCTLSRRRKCRVEREVSFSQRRSHASSTPTLWPGKPRSSSRPTLAKPT